MTHATPPTRAYDWRTIAALNAVSTLAQIGQFGTVYVMLPVWLALQGLSAAQLGFFAASLWLGQMPGLGLAPWLCRHWGARSVVTVGLACSVVALVGMLWVPWPAYLGCGLLAGLGLGLRWVGLEPWLYRIAPAHARGRLVGFHETLIAAAPVVAPAIAAWAGMQGPTLVGVGVGFTVAALLPLAFAHTPPVEEAHHASSWPQSARAAWGHRTYRQGLLIALCGGMLESALAGLFAVFAGDRGFDPEGIAHLLTAFGLGGLLLQYPVGWLADHWGLRPTGAMAALGTALVAALLAYAPRISVLPGVPVAFATMFVLGGLVTAFLTLALIAATKTPNANMAWNVSSLTMAYSLSAVMGPVAAGGAMTATNSVALMGFVAAVGVVMVGLLALSTTPARRGVH